MGKPNIVPLAIKPLSISNDDNNNTNSSILITSKPILPTRPLPSINNTTTTTIDSKPIVPSRPSPPPTTPSPPVPSKPPSIVAKSSVPPPPIPRSKMPPTPPLPPIRPKKLEELVVEDPEEEDTVEQEAIEVQEEEEESQSDKPTFKLGTIIQQGRAIPMIPIPPNKSTMKPAISSPPIPPPIVPRRDIDNIPLPIPSKSNPPLPPPPRRPIEDVTASNSTSPTSNAIKDPKQFKPNRKLLTEGSRMLDYIKTNVNFNL